MSSGSETWRVFCAVELPADVRRRLEEHASELRKLFPNASASWTRVENIHLTLKFFGNVARDRIPAISNAAARTVKEFSAFEFTVGGTGVFPRASRAQVLWIGVNDPAEKLSALQRRLEDECGKEGFEKENRAFRPHLTMARLRSPERQLAEAHLGVEFKPIAIKLSWITIFRSELSSKGSRYTTLSHHKLSDS